MSAAPRESHSEPSVSLVALATGVIAGCALGVIDGLWSSRELGQFLPTLGSRAQFYVFLAALYGLFGGAIAALATLAVRFFLSGTRAGDLLRFAKRAHEDMRQRNPREALAGLAIALAATPIISGALGVGYWLAVKELVNRKHFGLTIAVAMLYALVAVVVGLAASLIAARPLEHGLARLAKRPALGRTLSSLWAPPIAVGILLVVAGAVAAAITWKTLSLLPLRPYMVALAFVALCPLAIGGARGAGARLARLAPWPRRGATAGVLVTLTALLLVTGGNESVGKASSSYSGLGEPLARGLRFVGDWDRDGYSRWLGGGDCDDGDANVHPRAAEIPDDGIDNNCVGGDATLRRAADDVGFAQVPPSVPPVPNVVVITIDTVRADHLGAYGYSRPTSPNLDALANRGTLFENGWAHAPSTRYSIPAILTGRFPLAVRYDDIPGQWPGLSEDNTTIPEIAKAQGLTTGAILNYWYFDAHRKMNQGVDHYDNQNKRFHKQAGREGPAKTTGSSSKEQTDLAVQFVERHRDEPFFLWVHYYDPHYAYEKHDGVPDFGTGKIDLYDNEIAYTDKHIGRLLDGLKAAGIDDKTVVVVTGDHGEGFGEHGIDLHGYDLYAAQTKVPFIVYVPGVKPTRVTTPVSHVDILPTIANLLGAQPTEDMMGRSLVDSITGQRDPKEDRWIFQQLSYENNNEKRAAASKDCHVLYSVSPVSSWQLYRLDRDPDESQDVIGDPGPCKDARSTLEAWFDQSEIPEGASDALLPGRPTLPSETPVDFGGELRLLSVEMPGQVRRAESFEMVMTWEARGTLEGNWRVFAHFEGPKGGRFIGDHHPTRPFSWWRRGQFIQYSHKVTIPKSAPLGSYDLWLGVFDKGERREATSDVAQVASDRARMGSLEVTE